MNLIYTIEEIDKAANFVLDNLETTNILLVGNVGAGKTTLIKQICLKLGVSDLTNSPTFSLINEYKIKNTSIFHMDLYRLKNINEVIDLGVMEYIDFDNTVIIEWPELLIKNFNFDYSKIEISIVSDNRRRIMVSNEFF